MHDMYFFEIQLIQLERVFGRHNDFNWSADAQVRVFSE